MSKTDRRKTALFESIAVMGKAFASPRRLELLDLLAQGPRTVDQLAKASKQSTANASQHLQALHAAGLVSREREGNKVRYDLAGEDVLQLWLALRDTSAERLAEVERSARDYLGEEVEAIDRTELFIADEVFFCGTGAQVAPCVKVDGRDVGDGTIGPVARRIGDVYFAIARGDDKRHAEWRTAVHR